jgi:hypothetical protein
VTGTPITDQQYPAALDALVNATRAIISLADALDIPAMRSICERHQALGPVLEPTAYQRGGMDNLRDQASFLAALDRFVTDVRKLDRRPR